MNKIIQLPSDLVTRIAAGEVVERPASVLKECIENSLDAGATNITVQIEGAGRTSLSIHDNGCGMSKDDARLSLSRHATSKIKKLEDLESIDTFGFRGEALPSIASVSKMRLVTRRHEDENGWEIVIEGGIIRSEKPIAREPGTSIEVRDLFYNTPARYKFLKADSTERGQCIRVVEEMAFSSMNTTFHLTTEKNKPVVFKRSNMKDRVADVWGNRISVGLKTISSVSPHFALSGVVTDPHHHQATSRHQFLFINQRPVLNRRLSRAVYNAFTGALPTLRHPAFVLFLKVNPQTIDVNVHPSKREVKLTHEGELFGFIMNAVKAALMMKSSQFSSSWNVRPGESVPRRILVQDLDQSRSRSRLIHPPQADKCRDDGTFVSSSSAEVRSSGSVPWRTEDPRMSLKLESRQKHPGMTVGTLTALAQVKKMFIIAESQDGIFILDQHAAAERVTYERLLNNLHSSKPQIQMLLVPFHWEVARSLYSSIQAHVPSLQKIGFLIEPFGEETFLIKGYPHILGEKFELNSLLDGMSEVLDEPSQTSPIKTENFHHKLAALTACKASVKAGDKLDLKECQVLMDQIVKCESPLTCPHGRPTFIEYGYEDLKRKFGR